MIDSGGVGCILTRLGLYQLLLARCCVCVCVISQVGDERREREKEKRVRKRGVFQRREHVSRSWVWVVEVQGRVLHRWRCKGWCDKIKQTTAVCLSFCAWLVGCDFWAVCLSFIAWLVWCDFWVVLVDLRGGPVALAACHRRMQSLLHSPICSCRQVS